MADLRELTQQYVAAFNAKDINGISNLLAHDFTLNDPTVRFLGPRHKAIEYVQKLFTDNPSLSFEMQDIVVEAPFSVLHFRLELQINTYDGIDLIKWDDKKIQSIHAYLTMHTIEPPKR